MKKKILVVDDEPDLVAAIKARLEKSGYQVIPAYSGEEALKALRQEKPDAVILDILMPEPNGLKVLKKIRMHDKKLPVFILTGLKDKERFVMARRLNASGFILKTNDLKKELEHITSALRISEGYRQK